MLPAGVLAPDFTLPSSSGRAVRLHEHLQDPVVLYFYPEDGTAGCTMEARLFRAYFASLGIHRASIFGVSRDSVESHCVFRDALDLPFELLADEDGAVHDLYGAWREMRFGRGRRPRRCTFIIAPDGTIAKAYARVNPATHPRNVLRDLETIGHREGWLAAH